MQIIDIQAAKYEINRMAREFDSTTFVPEINEHYDGEYYTIIFQRGSHTYSLEVEGERLAGWLKDGQRSQDMEETVRLAVEELGS
ncbi:MAG TPA: hypothetical protein PLU88_15575 [Armatimonadota bacterium]|nr:hypothetical protein [Armatimonadota bacterium]HOM70645.1 hypothetical protein [Armatimonadota bacterium]HOP80275.1 hypothetical protein [Armatimonadota bacterium]HPP76538.1 hypothetical protein [Armatimonadota bacterium]